MKYSVRKYYATFVDVEVEANTTKEAIEIAENIEPDMGQVSENMVPSDESEARVIEPSTYEMKVSLEEYGWDWNVLDMMSEDEIKLQYEEMCNLKNIE